MFPEKVKILGHEYDIVLKDNYLADSDGQIGQCNNYTNTITIAANIPKSSQTEVLVHEIIEAVNHRLELGLEHHKICVLGETLHQIIRDSFM